MPYNFDSPPSRRHAPFFSKWTAFAGDVLPMWVADADFPTAPQIIKALHKKVEHGVLGYELPSKLSNQVIAARMKKLYNWDVDPNCIVYTAGVNNGYNIAARILCSPQKGYLIQTPVYNEFLDAEQKTGARQRVARLEKKVEGNRISYHVDFDAFAREVKKCGMFLLCHPHNPVGKVFSKAELRRMAEICIENGVTIVSDEIHSELLLDGVRFTPMAGISRKVAQHTVTLISASKAFNVPGLACAFAMIPDETLRKQFVKVASGMSFEASTPGLTAAQIAFSGKADSWLNALRRYLTANRNFVLDYVEKNMPGVRMTKPDATYLIWLDCTELRLKPSPYEFFLKQAKVALSDGAKFGKGNEQFVRLNFGTSRKLLAEGLKRMSRALK